MSYTNVINARQEFDSRLYGAFRTLGLRAHIQRRRVWIEGAEAHFFDLALASELDRFRRFKAGVFSRALVKRGRKGRAS
jgi:hypothetical protein